jgi:hypothetical protein
MASAMDKALAARVGKTRRTELAREAGMSPCIIPETLSVDRTRAKNYLVIARCWVFWPTPLQFS